MICPTDGTPLDNMGDTQTNSIRAQFSLNLSGFRACVSGRVDDGQTNSVLFDRIRLVVERRSEPATTDGLTTDGLNSSGRRASFRAGDSGRVDDGQTNSVLFD